MKLLKAHFPSFFAKPMGGVIVDRVLQSLKAPDWQSKGLKQLKQT